MLAEEPVPEVEFVPATEPFVDPRPVELPDKLVEDFEAEPGDPAAVIQFATAVGSESDSWNGTASPRHCQIGCGSQFACFIVVMYSVALATMGT